MPSNNRNGAMATYQNVGVSSGITDADPHKLISMIMQGVLDSLARARGALENQQVATKGEQISRAISLVELLRSCLDHESGGEVSRNLESLYEYMSTRLLMANANSKIEWMDEVASLMREIKAGWDEIPPDARALRQTDPADAQGGPLVGSNEVIGSC
ncbi:MAG: flagellar export chaperone FliS [Pseudomonadota bacterium]